MKLFNYPSKVTTLANLFLDCTSLTKVDLSHWNPTITYAETTFSGCTSLKEIRLDGWTNLNSVTLLCSSLPNRMSGIGYVYAMFNVTLPLGWALHKLVNPLCVLEYTTSKSGVKVNFVDRPDSDFTYIESDNGNGTYSVIVNANSDFTLKYIRFDSSDLTSVQYIRYKDLTLFTYMFQWCDNLTSINDIATWDTSNVKDMSRMFSNCSSLTELDLSGWNVSGVTDFSYMFSSCSNLTTLDLSGWELVNHNVNSALVSMFDSCSKLTTLYPMQNIYTDINLSKTQLDKNSLLRVIDNLATVTSFHTLTLGSTLLGKLSTSEKRKATDKGWTLQ